MALSNGAVRGALEGVAVRGEGVCPASTPYLHFRGLFRTAHAALKLSKRVFVSTQVLVPGTTTTALLQQLLPNTEYNVGVVALYSDGEGPAISDAGKTSKNQFRTVRVWQCAGLVEVFTQ